MQATGKQRGAPTTSQREIRPTAHRLLHPFSNLQPVSSQMNDEKILRYQTTIGWSLITSAIVTFALAAAPGESIYYGIGLLLVGVIVFLFRKTH